MMTRISHNSLIFWIFMLNWLCYMTLALQLKLRIAIKHNHKEKAYVNSRSNSFYTNSVVLMDNWSHLSIETCRFTKLSISLCNMVCHWHCWVIIVISNNFFWPPPPPSLWQSFYEVWKISETCLCFKMQFIHFIKPYLIHRELFRQVTKLNKAVIILVVFFF